MLLFGVGILAIVVQFASDPWETFKILGGAVIACGSLIVLVRLAASAFSSESSFQSEGPRQLTTTTTQSGNLGRGSGEQFAPTGPEFILPVVIIGLVAVFIFLLFRRGSGLIPSEEGPTDNEEDTDFREVSRAAGEAADRISSASTPRAADNEIYRAWTEMLSLIGTSDPQSSTPRAFEAAAVEAGLDPNTAHELTQIFEEVRYGEASLTSERREQAVAALRKIESARTDTEKEEP
jgi:hypothetical protein